ncbi:MAG: 1,4-dihydroxy-6-naphthoate synthase [Bacteroidales bacterium]
MRLKLNFSTCPNDTFMFGALVNSKINSGDYLFDVMLSDIEELNGLAVQGIPDVTKLSFGVLPKVAGDYQLLDSGSALGKGVGPLVVSRKKIYPDEVSSVRVALPGEHTTAHLLFNLAFPGTRRKSFYRFSNIQDVVLSNEADAGVIIHESRFTYQAKGLLKVMDLGDFWEKKTGLPTPLGGVAVRKSLPENVRVAINQLLCSSIEFAFKNPQEVLPYVKQYAQEMDTEVMLKHIDLYVNKFSLSLGNNGRMAIVELLKASNKIPNDFDEGKFFIG